MNQCDFTDEALRDLEDIGDYIALDSPSNAEWFVDRLEAACRRIADMPGMGIACPDLGSGIRRFPHGEYLIYYRPTAHAVEIVRVLHGARDPRRSFRQSPGQ